jgi:hypothetical protein
MGEEADGMNIEERGNVSRSMLRNFQAKGWVHIRRRDDDERVWQEGIRLDEKITKFSTFLGRFQLQQLHNGKEAENPTLWR